MKPEPLAEEEFTQMLELLARFCATDLDQFDHWKLSSDYGDVFIDINRKQLHEGYREIR